MPATGGAGIAGALRGAVFVRRARASVADAAAGDVMDGHGVRNPHRASAWPPSAPSAGGFAARQAAGERQHLAIVIRSRSRLQRITALPTLADRAVRGTCASRTAASG